MTTTTAKMWKRCASPSGDEAAALCVPAPKRRSIECTTLSGNSNRSSGDCETVAPSPTCSEATNSFLGRTSTAPTPASPQPHMGVPASAAEQPQQHSSSKAPAVGVPLAMPSGFGLPFPFMPPPLMYFWMQQMAVQQAATYWNSQQKGSSTGSISCPPPFNAVRSPDAWDTGMTGSCPATSPACSSMPQPLPFPSTGSPHSLSSQPPPPPQIPEPASCCSMPMPMPPFPSCPPPPPPMDIPDLAHLPPPEELPHVADSLGNSTIGGKMCAAGKVDCGSSHNSSFSETGVLDNDVASFIDSFLLSGPEQTLHCDTPQVDLQATDAAEPPLGLHLSCSAAEEVLDVFLHNENEENAVGHLGGLMEGLPPAVC